MTKYNSTLDYGCLRTAVAAVGLLALLWVVGAIFFTRCTYSKEHPVLSGTQGFLPADTARSATGLGKVRVNFYLENSGSMDGYVNGGTELKDALGKMLVRARSLCGGGTPLHFVSDAIYASGADADVQRFVGSLTPAGMKVGNTGQTDINSIFGMLLRHTGNDTVSVLFSDCVYSIKDGKTSALLSQAENATTEAFADAIARHPDLGVIVLQMQSAFNGTYYDRLDTPISYNGRRPYYVFLMGRCDVLREMDTRMRLSDLPGYRNKCFLSAQSWTLNEATAHLISSDLTNARRIKPMRGCDLDADRVELGREVEGQLNFAVALGVSNLFADTDYLLDRNNYEVEPSTYKVTEVKAISQASPAYVDCEGFTAPLALCLSAPTDALVQKVVVRLKAQLPAWVKKASVADDAGRVPPSTQSFAIDHILGGVFNAYDMESRHLFEMEININKYQK